MDKVSDGLIQRLRLTEKSWRTLPVEGIWSRGLTIDRDAFCNDLRDAADELAASRKETDTLTGAVLDLREKLAAQKEHYRVLEEEMLVLGDERLCATLDAKENMEIANEFKCLMEEYRQRAEAAYKQSHIDAIDAERYRWLRLQSWHCSPLAVVTKPIEAIKLGYDCPSGNRLDALIDDSMREMK